MKGILMSVTENDLVPYIVKIDARARKIEPRAAPGRQAGGGGAGRRRAVALLGAAPARCRLSGRPPVCPDAPAAALARGSTAANQGSAACRQPGSATADVRLSSPRSIQRSRVLRTSSRRLRARRLQRRRSAAHREQRAAEVQRRLARRRQRRDRIPRADKDGYGQIGFYVGGTGEVRIKDFMYKDILSHVWAPDETGKNFKQVRVDPHYYSWSTAVADFNHDGTQDIAAGAFYYLGPDYKVGRQIYTPVSFNPTSEWPIPAMVNLAFDFTGDGWADVLQMGGNAGNGTGFLFVNPAGSHASGREVPRRFSRSATRRPSSRTSTATAVRI